MMNTDYKRTGVEALAAFVTKNNHQPLSENAKRAARLCILDTLGAGIYGSTQPEAQMFLQAANAMGTGNTTVWGTGDQLEAGMTAMVCGSLCHLRELDDVHYAILHTGCVCVPAALAAAELENSTYGEVLRAVTNGVEAMAQIALSMDYMDHRERGWHGTATCGAFGSAAAVGYLLKLNETQLADALGLAGSRTGGTWAFSSDGAMSKRLHPGLAARDGLVAAYFAKAGVPGPHYVLESTDGGFYRLFAKSWNIDRIGASTEKLEVENVEFKWFASCKSVHSPITAALQIHRENPHRKPEEVSSVTVKVNRSALSMAGHSYEENSVVSAQISIPYGVALGLTGREGQADDYSLDALKSPVLRMLSDRIRVVESETFNKLRHEKHLSGTQVTVEWTDGTRSAAVVTEPKGSLGNPLTEEDVVSKFLTMTSCVLGADGAKKLLDFVMNSDENTPISQLTALIVPK